jgi:hypothetical protein
MKKNILVIGLVGLLIVLYAAPKQYAMLCIIAFVMLMLPLYLNARKEEQEEYARINKRYADEQEAKEVDCLCSEVAGELFDIEEWDAWVESAAAELRTVQFEEDRAREQAKAAKA